MKKMLFLGALMLVMASCTKDKIDAIDDADDNKTTPSTELFKQLDIDQSRIIMRDPNYAASSRAITRIGETADLEHPYVTCPTVSELKARGVKEFNSNEIYNGGEFLISSASSATKFDNIYPNNKLTLYVAKSNVEIWLGENNNQMIGDVYVLPVDGDGNPVENVSFPSWYPSNACVIPNGWSLRLWDNNVDFGSLLSFNRNACFYYYGAEELKIPEISQSKPNDGEELWFECHGPVRFTGNANFKQGKYWFGNNVSFDGKLEIDEQVAIKIDFKECANINNIDFSGSNDYCDINVDYFLELPNGFNSIKGSKFRFNLNNAVLVLGGESPVGRVPAGAAYGDGNVNSGTNVFVENKYIYGMGNSAVFIQGSVYAWKDQISNGKLLSFKTGSYDSSVAKSGNDVLAVFGKRYVDPQTKETVTEAPVINYWISDLGSGQFVDDGRGTQFVDDGVTAKESDLDDDFVIRSKEEFDCRADYTWDKTPPQNGILPPPHKYSATGIAFNGDYVYVCWHSNLPGGEMQGDEWHDHGTNMDPDREDEAGYGGPSVENPDDWGGIVEIIRIDKYNPDDEELYPAGIADSYWQPEHKYNHVTYYGNKLYLATTSWNVGAALHVIPIVSEDASSQNLDMANAYRVNLTGKSANCVDIVGNESIVTISGRSEGGLNWFSLTDESNQTKKYINSQTSGYGGKYIYDDGKYVYALHNTDEATITAYNYSGAVVGELNTHIPLVPYDGKNAMVVKNGYVYVCCGRSGMHVFDWNNPGEKVGQTKLSANCVDVDDDGYIYVATGGGVAVLKLDSKKSDTKEFNVINYVPYTGRGFIYPKGYEEFQGTMPDKTEKESSNFICVRGGSVFVAYGMYGLRIYSVKELINAK